MTPRTLITVFAAAAAFVAAAPAASAAPLAPTYPVTFTEDGTDITVRYHDYNSSSLVLIDSNDDGKADKTIRVWPTQNGGTYASISNVTTSTTTCHETRPGGTDLPVTLTRGVGNGVAVELRVPKSMLAGTFVAKSVPSVSTYACSLPGYGGVQATMQDAARFGPSTPPLAAPANLLAVAGNEKVTLTWDPVPGAGSYVIYRDGVRVKTNVTGGPVDLIAPNGKTYSFEVVAVKAPVESLRSNTATATPTVPLPQQLDAPTNLQAVAGDGQVRLTWTEVDGADAYVIFRDDVFFATAEGSPVDVSSPNGHTYTFEVVAVNATQGSARSNPATATPSAPPMAAPTNLRADAGDGQIRLYWDEVPDAASYLVYQNGTFRQTAGGGYTDVAGLANGTTYTFQVVAVSFRGVESARSTGETVTPQAPPNIPLAAPGNVTAVAGDGVVVLSWNPVPGAASYRIYADGTVAQAVDGANSQGVVTVANDRTYRFEVAAVKALGSEGLRSASVYATPTAVVVTDPPVDPQPPVGPPPPAGPQPPVDRADTDADGITNDWIVNGKPAPAPAKPKAGRITSTSVTVQLPKAPKGTTFAVYVRAANGRFVKVKAKPDKKGVVAINGLKHNTRYEFAIVKVKAGKQSAASKLLKVKTKNK